MSAITQSVTKVESDTEKPTGTATRSKDFKGINKPPSKKSKGKKPTNTKTGKKY